MQKLIAALLLPILAMCLVPSRAISAPQEAAKTIQQAQSPVAPLSNLDVLRMVKADFTASTIVAQINSSPCDFVTTPAALQQLKEEGVPDSVVVAMVTSPRSGPIRNHSSEATSTQQRVNVRIPAGLAVEIEAPFTVSSQDVREGDAISFRVVNPIKVDGVTVIAAGATATARVEKASRGGHFGRAGRLAWSMRDVTAVDGTRIPLQTAGRVVGDSKGAKVATAMIITGALFWVAAPVALLHGFKRGENAILPAGKRLEVSVQSEVAVKGVAP
jgi:hypothetical protein